MIRKIIFTLILLMIFNVAFAGNEWTTQEIFNLVKKGTYLGAHYYTTQDVLNLCYDASDSTLMVYLDSLGTLDIADTLFFNDDANDNFMIYKCTGDTLAFGYKTAGTWSDVIIFDSSGDFTAYGDITVSNADPVLNFKDTDCGDGDIGGLNQFDATITTSGAEDYTYLVQHQVDGALQNIISAVAETGVTLSSHKGDVYFTAGGGEVIFNDDTHIGQDDAAENLEIHDGGTFKMWDLSDDTSITFDVDDGTTELDLTGSLEVSVDIKLLGGNLTISDGTDTAQISMIQETGLGERLTICVDEDSRTVVICDIGDINTDFGLTAAAEPRLVFIDAGGTEKAEIYKSQYLFAIRNFDDNIALYGRGVTNYMNADREAANVFSFESETIHYELTDTDGEQSWIYVGARIDQSLTAAANILKLEMAEEVLGDGTTGLGNNWILCENVSGDAEFKIDLSGEVSTYGNSANAAFTMLNLINTDEQSTTETGQTSDLEFKVQGTIDSGSNYTDEEAFKISAIKTSDYFHAADQTDNDSKVEFSPVTDGSYVVAMTLEDNDATIADDCDVVGDFTAGTIASDAGLSGTTLALTAGITQSPTATGNLYDLQLENEWTNGVVMIGNYGSATTLSGDIAGIYFDFETQITSVNKDIDGFKIKLPAQTNTGDDPYASTGYSVSGGALDMSAGAGSTTWKGLDVTMPNITETAGTVNSYGVYIAGGTVTSGTEYGIYVNSADSYFGGDVTSTNTVQAEQLTSTDDALIKDALTLGDDVNNTSGTLNWIASDADAGSFAIGTSDNFAVTGFTGGFDIDGDCTVGTLISDAGVGGTTGTFSSTLSAGNTFTQETYVIRKHVAITGAADNAATNFFTITTTDETGDVDGGGYTVNLYVMAGESLANNSTNTAIMSMTCHFGRIMVGAGTGTNSAVAEISQSASAGEGTGAIANVTITVVETSEFIQTVQVTVDINGGTADATAIVELIYSDFTTSPVIAGI